ncbi:transcriptional regulator, partial [Nonomuraea wenchangensis]
MATTTAAQQRAQAKARYDAFVAACPSRKLLDRISNKWVTLILAALGSGGGAPPERGGGAGRPPADGH